MTRIVTTAFTLNLPEGQKPFVVGAKLEGADAEHWYSQAHSEELDEAPAVDAEVKPKGRKAKPEVEAPAVDAEPQATGNEATA